MASWISNSKKRLKAGVNKKLSLNAPIPKASFPILRRVVSSKVTTAVAVASGSSKARINTSPTSTTDISSSINSDQEYSAGAIETIRNNSSSSRAGRSHLATSTGTSRTKVPFFHKYQRQRQIQLNRVAASSESGGRSTSNTIRARSSSSKIRTAGNSKNRRFSRMMHYGLPNLRGSYDKNNNGGGQNVSPHASFSDDGFLLLHKDYQEFVAPAELECKAKENALFIYDLEELATSQQTIATDRRNTNGFSSTIFHPNKPDYYPNECTTKEQISPHDGTPHHFRTETWSIMSGLQDGLLQRIQDNTMKMIENPNVHFGINVQEKDFLGLGSQSQIHSQPFHTTMDELLSQFSDRNNMIVHQHFALDRQPHHSFEESSKNPIDDKNRSYNGTNAVENHGYNTAVTCMPFHKSYNEDEGLVLSIFSRTNNSSGEQAMFSPSTFHNLVGIRSVCNIDQRATLLDASFQNGDKLAHPLLGQVLNYPQSFSGQEENILFPEDSSKKALDYSTQQVLASRMYSKHNRFPEDSPEAFATYIRHDTYAEPSFGTFLLPCDEKKRKFMHNSYGQIAADSYLDSCNSFGRCHSEKRQRPNTFPAVATIHSPNITRNGSLQEHHLTSSICIDSGSHYDPLRSIFPSGIISRGDDEEDSIDAAKVLMDLMKRH